MSLSLQFTFQSSSLESKLPEFNSLNSSSSMWNSMQVNSNSRRIAFQTKASLSDPDSDFQPKSQSSRFQTKAALSDPDSDSQPKSQSVRVTHFKDCFYDECKDLIRAALRKSLVRTLTSLDLLILWAVTKTKSYDELVKKAGVFCLLFAIVYFVMKVAALAHFNQDKKGKNK